MANLTLKDTWSMFPATRCLRLVLLTTLSGGLFLGVLLLIYSPDMELITDVDIQNNRIKSVPSETKSPLATYFDSAATRLLEAQQNPSRYHGNGPDCKEDAEDLLAMGNRVLSWDEMKNYTANNLMSVKPPPYLNNFRSPCWLQRMAKYNDNATDGVTIACFPGVYLAGMPKCGTTDLYRQLCNHGNIVGNKKEPHYWTRNIHGRSRLYKYSAALLGEANMSDCSTNTRGTFHRQLVLDGSASTLWDARSWRARQNESETEPTLLVPRIIHRMTPGVKAIALLRDPVERLFSGYLYFHKTGHNKKSTDAFHHEVRLTVSSFHNCTQWRSERTCAYYWVTYTRPSKVRLPLGLYILYITDWIATFGRDRLHVLRLEDYSQNKALELSRIFKFLGLETKTDLNVKADSRANRGKMAGHIAMRNDTRDLLRTFYAPYNRRLADLLGDEKYLWGYS